MEFHEIPDRLRSLLVESGECWVLANPHRTDDPAVQQNGSRTTLRRILWRLAGRHEIGKRKLHPQCGTDGCHRPEHHEPGTMLAKSSREGQSRLSRKYWHRMQRTRFVSRFELEVAVSALRRRGFELNTRRHRGALATMTYRVALDYSKHRTPENMAAGPWWLWWQEPLRMAGTKAERRAAA